MIASEFYSVRRSFRVVFKECYAERIAYYQGILRDKMDKWKIGPLQTALRCMEALGERMPDPGMAQAWIMCAVVELLEPLPRESEASPAVPSASARTPGNG